MHEGIIFTEHLLINASMHFNLTTEQTSFSAGKFSSNKKLYLFLNLHANKISKCQATIKLTACTRVRNHIGLILRNHAMERERNGSNQLGEKVSGLNSTI